MESLPRGSNHLARGCIGSGTDTSSYIQTVIASSLKLLMCRYTASHAADGLQQLGGTKISPWKNEKPDKKLFFAFL